MIWGRDRVVLELLAAALARAVGPIVYWFEIDDLTSPKTAPVAIEKPDFGGLRFFRLRPKEVALTDPSPGLSHWVLLPGTESASLEQNEVRDFLRIPDAIQSVLGEAGAGSVPSSMVISNVDRASEHYPPTAGTFTPFIQMFNQRNVTPIFTNGGTPRENVWDFDVVLHVEVSERGVAECTCEKGRPDSGFGPFQKGIQSRVDSICRLLAL